ncbi:hypothetical protein LN42_01975 [Marinitoga sp. 1137]|uniref:helix-turn-helix domain-containing protein n=1 Tax=Marinitoga sp. 1137 TaxID=1545835 RepID=UPI0009503C79|nr:helix-turn-helix transcriptional regulator [Marinitoga sp. 1137]APT75293.1 hypothetical protein LN42_01975 [Marinitoga sp. 1137]
MNRIKELRKKKGLSIKYVSEKTKLAYSTIVRIENGILKNPKYFTLKKIANVLGVNVDDLFDNDIISE